MFAFTLIFLLDWPSISDALVDLTRYGKPKIYSEYINNVTALYDELFTRRAYNDRISPVYGWMPDNTTASPVAPLNTEIEMYYMQIISLDAENQILSTLFQTNMYWTDDRLAWDPKDYGGIDQIYLNEDLFWLPDINLGNTRALVLVHPDQIRTFHLRSDGKVMMPAVYHAETARFITINGSISKLINFKLQGNGEWELRNMTTEAVTYGEGQQSYVVFSFWVHLRRVPNFYVYVIALPCFILTMLSSVGMFWTPNYKADQLTKLGIGLTSLVSMTVLLQMLSDAIPKTSDFPILGIYVVLCVGLTSFACVNVVVFPLENFHRKTNVEIKKSVEEDKKLGFWAKLKKFIRQDVLTRHFCFHVFFQSINLIGFIVFLSFWN